MVTTERKPTGVSLLLEPIRSKIKDNKKRYPEAYFRDDWWVINSPIVWYEKDFAPVMRGINIVEFAKQRKPPVVIDLMASSGSLVSLFAKLSQEDKCGLAVSLCDKRDDWEKERDEKLGIRQLTGDILKGSTWRKIEKELDGRKADLIIERAVGGLNFLPMNKNVYAALMEKAWNILSEQGGVLLTQMPPDFALAENSGHDPLINYEDVMAVESWLKHLIPKKIKAVYNPSIRICSVQSIRAGILKLTKTPDSAKNLIP